MLIRKFIIRSGKTPIGYEGATVDFAPSRLVGWAEKANQMIREGFDIPAPPLHDERAVPHKAGVILSGEENAFDNLGFWKRFETVEEFDSNEGERYTALYGIIDAEGDKEDAESPAGKLFKRIKKVSIRTYDRFVDSAGKVWNDVIVHVAPCLHAALQNQKPFEELSGDHPGLAFSVALAAVASSEAVESSEFGTQPKNDDVSKTQPKEGDELDDAALIKGISQKLRFAQVFVKPAEDCRKFLEAMNIALDQLTGGETGLSDPNDADKNLLDDKNLLSRRGERMSVGTTQTNQTPPVEPTKTGSVPPTVTDAGTPAPVEQKFDPSALENGIMLSVAKNSLAPQVRSDCQRRLEALKTAGVAEEVVKQIEPLIADVTGVKLSVAKDDATGEYRHTPTEAEKALDFVEKTMKGIALSTSQANGNRGSDGSIANPHRSAEMSDADYEKELDKYFPTVKNA